MALRLRHARACRRPSSRKILHSEARRAARHLDSAESTPQAAERVSRCNCKPVIRKERACNPAGQEEYQQTAIDQCGPPQTRALAVPERAPEGHCCDHDSNKHACKQGRARKGNEDPGPSEHKERTLPASRNCPPGCRGSEEKSCCRIIRIKSQSRSASDGIGEPVGKQNVEKADRRVQCSDGS